MEPEAEVERGERVEEEIPAADGEAGEFRFSLSINERDRRCLGECRERREAPGDRVSSVLGRSANRLAAGNIRVAVDGDDELEDGEDEDDDECCCCCCC